MWTKYIHFEAGQQMSLMNVSLETQTVRPRRTDLCDRQAYPVSFAPGYMFATDKIEPSREKTNNVVSEQVRHKPACTSAEKS